MYRLFFVVDLLCVNVYTCLRTNISAWVWSWAATQSRGWFVPKHLSLPSLGRFNLLSMKIKFFLWFRGEDDVLGMLITVLPLDATCLVVQACR